MLISVYTARPKSTKSILSSVPVTTTSELETALTIQLWFQACINNWEMVMSAKSYKEILNKSDSRRKLNKKSSSDMTRFIGGV